MSGDRTCQEMSWHKSMRWVELRLVGWAYSSQRHVLRKWARLNQKRARAGLVFSFFCAFSLFAFHVVCQMKEQWAGFATHMITRLRRPAGRCDLAGPAPWVGEWARLNM